MPQPVSKPITSTPAVDGQPYDPCTDSTPPFKKLDANAGVANINTGRVEHPYDDDGHGWHQT